VCGVGRCSPGDTFTIAALRMGRVDVVASAVAQAVVIEGLSVSDGSFGLVVLGVVRNRVQRVRS